MATALAEVHAGVRLWLLDLDAADAGGDRALLSGDELAREARFAFEQHRRRFVAGRAALRRILGAEVSRAPETLDFDYGAAGKPALRAPGGVHFNLSHSDQWAIVAVTRAGAIGVDIEKRRPLADVLRLARTAFSPGELDELHRLPAAEQEQAFFTVWTRKEAYIKARGDGLARLGDFDVSLAADRPALLRVAGSPPPPGQWSLASFVPVPGYAGALCVERVTASSADRR